MTYNWRLAYGVVTSRILNFFVPLVPKILLKARLESNIWCADGLENLNIICCLQPLEICSLGVPVPAKYRCHQIICLLFSLRVMPS